MAAAALAGPSASFAQAIERNLPPAPDAAAAEPLAEEALSSDLDDRPIGPALAAIVVLGPDAPVRANVEPGVEPSGAARFDPADVRRSLTPYLGQPLSRRLIARIQATLAGLYRDAGFPFVSVSTPEQEITGGVLQIRIVEYELGQLRTAGAGTALERRIRERMRLRPGEPIDARRTIEDLDWINRYPFRRVRPVASPGALPGLTDIVLNIEQRRPWRVYAGAANSGSAATGWERFYVGGALGGLPLLPDAMASYQFTSSADFWFDDGWVFAKAAHPSYASHAARLDLWPWPHAGLELTVNTVETNQASGFFASRLNVAEAVLSYRAALSDFTGLTGDAYAGLEAKRERSTLFFGGNDVLGLSADLIQAHAGWSGAWIDAAGGRTTLDLSAHFSPGGLSSRNGDGDLALFTQGRVRESRYAYVRAAFGRAQKLPRGFALVQRGTVQLALEPLPDTEQLSLGGSGAIRGYTVDDGGYDAGLVLQNELRAPELRRGDWRLSSYFLLDAGYLKDQFGNEQLFPVSVGLGAEVRRGTGLAAGAALAYAVSDAPATAAGDWRLEVRLSVSR